MTILSLVVVVEGRFCGIMYLHVAWFDEPWLVSQHLVDGEQVEYLGRDILQPLQPLRVTVVLQKFGFKNCHLYASCIHCSSVHCHGALLIMYILHVCT